MLLKKLDFMSHIIPSYVIKKKNLPKYNVLFKKKFIKNGILLSNLYLLRSKVKSKGHPPFLPRQFASKLPQVFGEIACDESAFIRRMATAESN